MLTRRQFLKLGAAAGVGLFLPIRLSFNTPKARAFYTSTGLEKFAQPLRGVGPGAIPVGVPDGKRYWGRVAADHYTIDINQYYDTLHPDLGPTTLWGYNPRKALGVTGVPTQKHLGGILVVQRNKPVQITFRNNLPPTHILPVDTTLMGVSGNQFNRVSTHLHGGFVPWISDGGPYAWWDPNGHRGQSFQNGFLNPLAARNEADVYYPNQQTARMMWYHDHAIGITRLNAYAGIATAYILRDDFESNLRNMGLPDYIENGGREIPLVFQDKVFVGSDIGAVDPAWLSLGVPSSPGSLWYPHQYDPARWDLDDTQPYAPPQDPSVIPEMFGDTMLVNGTVYPKATVEARRYRLRVLNACQARFLNLQLYTEDGGPGPSFLVIGTEGGFLSKPARVPSNQPINVQFDANGNFISATGSLITAPAERWDIIVDFSGYAGKNLILCNDAPAPFPMGDPINDFSGSGSTGPDTRHIMRFKVVPASGAPDPALKITTATNLTGGIDRSLVNRWTTQPIAPPQGVPVRQLTLNETFDDHGRLIQMLGTNQMTGMGFARAYMDPATETPAVGATEVWQIANLTGDTHPIHFHLVNCQVLSRQPFDAANYAGTPTYTGQARGPEPAELGWKETVKMNPNEVTTVIMRFDLPTVPFIVPKSRRTGGNEYVWHCHILEHEEHDMMRPLVVG